MKKPKVSDLTSKWKWCLEKTTYYCVKVLQKNNLQDKAQKLIIHAIDDDVDTCSVEEEIYVGPDAYQLVLDLLEDVNFHSAVRHLEGIKQPDWQPAYEL